MVKVLLEQKMSDQVTMGRIPENESHWVLIREFTAAKQVKLFETLKQLQFSGQLRFRDAQEREFIFYLYLGRLVYATGGTHPVRRWRRNITLYCFEIVSNLSLIQQDLATITAQDCSVGWEYQSLCLWLKQQKITREQVTCMIRGVVTEILFDLTQAGQVIYQLRPEKFSSTPLVIVDTDQIIVETWKLWHAWQAAKLADRSPNAAPAIKQLKELKSRTSKQTFQLLKLLLNGQVSLRDIAVNLKQDTLQLTRSLMLYIQSGLVKLVEIPDLPVPIVRLEQIAPPVASKQALVACVDDSPVMCQLMEKIVTRAGYDFISVNNKSQAIALFLAQQPDFIFIDFILPNTDGYEICRELRQFSVFRDTPMIILTETIGLVERVKAKMAGCSDLLTKPFDADSLLKAIAKYL